MCKETPDIEKCQTSYFMNRFVSSGSLSLFLCLCLAICLFLFCFVGLFSKAVFDTNVGLGMFCLCITLRVPFTSERFCAGLFLGRSPFAPLYCLSPIFHFSCGFFLFWLLFFSPFCSLLSRAS